LNLEFRYAEQFTVALALTSVTVIAHAFGMKWARRYFKRYLSLVMTRKPLKSPQTVMIVIVAIMMITHFSEVIIWALFYALRGIQPDWLSSVYFSVYSYTTLGASGISVPEHWRGIGGFEAMAAMLMFGWSTAVLASAVVELHRLDG